MTPTDIATRIEDAKDSPHELANLRVLLSAEFARISEQWKHVQRLKPHVWLEMRKEQKSDTSTDRMFAATDLGISEMELKTDLKTYEKLMSAVKARLDVHFAEARNQM
jgi:hypothetical protein